MGLRLHQLPPSPNNLRVRLALAIKGLDYENCVVPFTSDRSEIVELSTQPLTPVLEHDGRVIFDSSAILRYLEANFPDTPRLFSADRDEMREIEEWEYFCRLDLTRPVGMIFDQAFAPEQDAEEIEDANELMRAGTERIEEALEGRDFLLGDRITAADLFAAPIVSTTQMSADSPVGVVKFFAENLHLGPNRERTLAWLGRVMAYDQ